jgi:glucose/mannose-6-phosphate isomerase
MAVFDKLGMYEILENIYTQAEKGCELGHDISVSKPVNSIFIAAVGGSAMPGYILNQYMKDSKIPISVIEDYNLPEFANRESLVFAISYTGSQEETISMYKDALKKGCQIITISAGGKLKEISSFNKTKHVNLPGGLLARLAYPYSFFPILKILENSNIIGEQGDYIKKTIKILRHNRFEDITENIAEKIVEKTPLIYASSKYEVVAKKWKLNFNENTEIQSFYNVFPSALHNEISGFAKKNSEFYILLIKGDDEDVRLAKKVLILKDILKELGIPVTEVGLTGECYLAKIFSALLIGDWLSYNLAIKRNVDPSSRRIIEELEKRMQI